MRRARLAVLLLAAGVGAAAAQGLADPTRPPPGWLPKDPRVAEAAKAKGDDTDSATPVSVLLVGKTRRFALVRGELVGDKTAGTKIVDVKRNEVVVQTDRGRETLNLFPDVQKTPPRKQAGMGNKDQ